jgi:hypothetical protein
LSDWRCATHSLVALGALSLPLLAPPAVLGPSLGRTRSCQSTGIPPFCDCIRRASLRASASASSSEVGPPLRLRAVGAAEVEVEVEAEGGREVEGAVLRTAGNRLGQANQDGVRVCLCLLLSGMTSPVS